MAIETPNPRNISAIPATKGMPSRRRRGRPRVLRKEEVAAPVPRVVFREEPPEPEPGAPRGRADVSLPALTREWLSDLKYLRRSDQTIEWYRKKILAFQIATGVKALDDMEAGVGKAFLVGLAERGLSDETVHGYYSTIMAFARWADREGYPVNRQLLQMKGPKVSQKEREVFSERERGRPLEAAPSGWPLTAIQVLMGTGMRVGELCDLRMSDFEDEEDRVFLKIRLGKGAKFRRVPVSDRLARDIRRYLNRVRPEVQSDYLLLRADGQPMAVDSVRMMMCRLSRKLGIKVNAHKFLHTFATNYIENGGDIERLRKILGHTTYAMILRYVHLNKRDLHHEFEDRTPY